MELAETIADVRRRVGDWRAAGERVAFVPTMGNLHEGHLTLVRRAREVASRVVVSIFVNPLQFGPGEDFERYPRTLAADRMALEGVSADLLFLPAETEMYPNGRDACTQVEVPGLSGILCGASRPGHFRGVATVVTKLLNIVQPDVALFGEKDYQQLLVIRRLAADLDLPVAIAGVPTCREADGLAMSSRNGYLSAEERARAPSLNRTLRQIAERLAAGEGDYNALEQAGKEALLAAGLRPDYLAIRAADLGEPARGKPLVVLGAAWLGSTRLIDNVTVAGTSPR